MKLKILCFLVLIGMVNVCCGEQKVEFTNPAKTIMVKRSQPIFEITLQSNPTTGFSWFLKSYDNNLLKPIKHKFYPPTDKKLLGAPGYEKWTFRIQSVGFVVPQVTNIVLIYTRPWEDQGVQPINFRVVTYNDN